MVSRAIRKASSRRSVWLHAWRRRDRENPCGHARRDSRIAVVLKPRSSSQPKPDPQRHCQRAPRAAAPQWPHSARPGRATHRSRARESDTLLWGRLQAAAVSAGSAVAAGHARAKSLRCHRRPNSRTLPPPAGNCWPDGSHHASPCMLPHRTPTNPVRCCTQPRPRRCCRR